MAGNFFQNAFEKTKSLANQAVDSTKCAAQKTKIKGKISSENSNLDRIYTEIGRYYYNLNKEEAPEEIKHLFDSAAKGLENIAALEKEYREVEEQEHRIMNSGNQYQQTPPQGMYNPQMNGMPPQGMAPQMNGMPTKQKKKKNIKRKAIGFPDVFYAEINCLFYSLFSPGCSYLLLRKIRSGHFRIVCRGAGCFFRVLDFHLLRCIFHPLENHAFCIH